MKRGRIQRRSRDRWPTTASAILSADERRRRRRRRVRNGVAPDPISSGWVFFLIFHRNLSVALFLSFFFN